jgi:hypothetical protein
MEIDIFAVCDAATEQNGKLNILGAFNLMSTKTLPAIYPNCAIAGRISFNKEDSGVHNVKIQISDPSGKEILAGNSDIDFSLKEPFDTGLVNTIVYIRDFKFETYGKHEISMIIDDKKRAHVFLYINEIK